MVIFLKAEHVWGQTDSTHVYKLQISKDLPLDQVLQAQEPLFFSANRRLDSLKSIALNVSVLTREKLSQSGVTTVAEALQLFPEFVVKLKANGLYNVEYRGTKSNFNNSTGGRENLLLLINAVPFNDALSGEVWWEAIPVSIEDIERIEVVHSPQGTWYGYGGALAVVNIIPKKSNNTAGTQLKANLQAGQFQSYDYHGSLNVGINEHFSIRIGGHYQARQRFQDTYFINSVSRYVNSDSLLFYQPEAFQTHLYTSLSSQSSGFSLSSAYQWNDSVSLKIDLGNQNTQAQSLFLATEEIPFTTRESQNRWVDIHFSSPSWRSHVFYQSGDKDYAKGYAGLQYQTARTGARLEYHKALGRYGFLIGTEGIQDQYSPKDSVSFIPLYEEAITADQWSQLLLSVYLQQTAALFKERLYLESGQRVYHSLQELNFPLGYHFAFKWFFAKSTSLHASAGQIIQTSQQLLKQELPEEAIKTASYELSIQKQWMHKGMFRGSVFNQQLLKHNFKNQPQQNTPTWGSTLEAWYQINRWTVRGHATRLLTEKFSEDAEQQAYPAWMASLSGNFSTFFDRVNINASLFYYSEHADFTDSISRKVPSQWLINTKCSYRIWKLHSIYLNVRNLTNEQAIVVPFADQNQRMIMVGLNLSL